MTIFSRSLLLSTSMLALASMLAPAVAQDAPADQSSDQAVETVVVTGSRISTAGFEAPTPVTVVDATKLTTLDPANLVDALALLPEFKGSSTSSSAATLSLGGGGESFANLRGLGADRTLVLLNGQRVGPSTDTDTVDLALLPQALVSHMDVVTGGASAAYGSDAVAGVVNIILDNNLNGLRGNLEDGMSIYGDNVSPKASVAWGGELGSGLHLVAGVEYYGTGGVAPLARNFAVDAASTVTNPSYTPTNGQPDQIVERYVYLSNVTANGVILGGPLANTEFLPGGQTRQYTSCPIEGTSQICNSPQSDLANYPNWTYLASPQQRGNFYSRLTYDASDWLTVYADGLYGQSDTRFTIGPYTTSLNGAITITNQNAFLPPAVASEMAADNITSFSLGRYSSDFGLETLHRNGLLGRYTAGFDADLGDNWKLNGYGGYTVTENHTIDIDDTIKQNLANAVDSVLVNGQPECRSQAANPTCAPINLFGEGSPSAAAIAYINGVARDLQTYQQTAFSINLTGEPFSTWAGPLSVATGAEYRSEHLSVDSDPLDQASAFIYENFQPFGGKINVKEGYFETDVPLAKDMPFAENLDFDGAVRLTDYSVSGGVTTWKTGLNYTPIDGFRLRATESRDIRAPNMSELFTPPTTFISPAFDPKTGVTSTISQPTVGNPNLVPEKADTTSAGVVVEPAFLDGFSSSVDYYNIRIGGAISTLTTAQILTLCAQGEASICQYITRNNAGIATQVVLTEINLAEYKTSGFDFEENYKFSFLDGAIELRGLVNYLTTDIQKTPVSTIDYAGSAGDDEPRWTSDLDATYADEYQTIAASATYFGGGIRSALDNASNISIFPSTVSGVWYFDATYERNLHFYGMDWKAYVSGQNLFNQTPPLGFERSGNNYDRIGTMLRVGLRFSM